MISAVRDLYEPELASVRANRPAILAIHGGAWRGGDKAWVSRSQRNSASPGAPGFEPAEPQFGDVDFSTLVGPIGWRRDPPEPAVAS